MGWLRNKLDGLRALAQFSNFGELVLSRLFFRRNGLVVYQLGASEILIDQSAGDASGTRLVLTTSMYRRLLPALVFSEPIQVLDLGASGGGFPLLLQQTGLKVGKLCCVEMHPRTFQRLRFNTETNLHPTAITNLNAALNGDGRPTAVSRKHEGTGESIFSEHHVRGDCAVPGITFDEIVRSVFDGVAPDIVKMDIEGAEHEVINGPSCKSLPRCKYLIVEVHQHQDWSRTQTLEQLRSLGFTDVTPAGGEPDVHLLESALVTEDRERRRRLEL